MFTLRASHFSNLARISLAMSLGAALAGCGKANGGPGELVAPRVLVQEIHYAPAGDTHSFIAAIRSRIETDQGFRVGGKIATRLVETGQRVTAGQPLGKIDDVDLRLQKQQADAELAASKTALDQALADDRRAAELLAKGWTTQAAYDRAHAAAAEARGRNLRARRAVELAANSLDYATLRADADGVVTATFIEAGQVVAAGQQAIRLARLAEKEAVVALPETFVGQVRNWDARLTLWSQPGRSYRAMLRELAPAADPVTRTFEARFSLPDADDKVDLGMSATLTIAPRKSEPVARAPLSALIDQGRGSALWVVASDDRLELKPVAVRRYDGRDVEISSGVAEGDKVVILGAQKLEAGEKVRPTTQLAF
ncbi:efflux RND transporter periplasmic adaptor subunit [Rhodoblastus sp. 17X3]|uniref:efflux RND transporter periplasmic adaptor subunit n=1 Tax=Rhodoblastus sp. 17X3 TaxID=3047026 RepID=UPI0024B71D1F|nr:efflux RND transporter periplasmic adaptor subunit [Rhodoblastus sp. 17X3]MDI9847837.1 efflux RND transporter periplasmic adaptor subunit [Rhodoblastus sp. 17X3]